MIGIDLLLVLDRPFVTVAKFPIRALFFSSVVSCTVVRTEPFNPPPPYKPEYGGGVSADTAIACQGTA
jgi:hypothetical protein